MPNLKIFEIFLKKEEIIGEMVEKMETTIFEKQFFLKEDFEGNKKCQ